MSKDPDDGKSDFSSGDYINIVVNAIGDCLSAVPVAGAFITAVKNVGVNVAAVKQQKRVLHVLSSLAERIEGIEQIFEEKSKDDEFLILFYRMLYASRDEVELVKLTGYINLGEKLLETKLPYDETRLAIEILPSLTSYEVRLLQKIAAFGAEWKDADDLASSSEISTVVGTAERSDIKHLIAQLWKKGLILEAHSLRAGQNSSDNIETLTISKSGIALIALIS
jgi:hypothetical protein